MPKRTTIYGTERYNFLLALMGYLIHHSDEDISLDEIAQHFGLSVKEVDEAVMTMIASGPNTSDLFDIDWDAYEEEGKIRLTLNPGVDDVPKISARQAAALTTGLFALKSMLGDEEQAEIDELIEVIKSGSVGAPAQAPLAYVPGTIDSDAQVIRKAISESKQIRCDYRNAQGEKGSRDLDPLMLFSQDEIWYLWAYCPKREAVRSFRLDRMTNALVLDQPISDEARAAEIPEHVYMPSQTDTEVTVRVLPEAARLISEFRPEREPRKVGDGWVEFEVMVGDLQILGKVIAHYGGKAKVVAPEEARLVVRDYALKALGEDSAGFNQGVRIYEE